MLIKFYTHTYVILPYIPSYSKKVSCVRSLSYEILYLINADLSMHVLSNAWL